MRGLFLHAEWQSFWSFFVGESSPANLCLSFLNTEDTEFTEYHSAHLDRTEAASRQLMTRKLRTHITSLLNSASSHRASLSRPTGEGWGGAPISPAPRRRAGEGPQFFFNTEDTEFTENHSAHFDNTDHRVAMDGCHGTCAPTSLDS